MEVARPFTDDQLKSDNVSKKQIIEFLQDKASSQFLVNHKLSGKAANIAKNQTKDDLIKHYNEFFETKAFKNEEEEKQFEEKRKLEESSKPVAKKEEKKPAQPEEKAVEKPRYTKTILKKGTGATPKKGDTVSCRYKGTLDDGKVFDQNMEKVKGKEPNPLKFKVGTGKVIRGWDEALLTMAAGEQARLVIESEWAYGKKGLPDAGIPPNARLTFEVELLSVE